MLRPAAEVFAQVLWPSRCAACEGRVFRREVFCAACQATLVPLTPACPGCALPGPPDTALCGGCRVRPLPFCRAVGAWAYGGALALALLHFKHGGRLHLARPLSALLEPSLAAEIPTLDAVLPVPLHPRRLRARGYNQALEIARALRRARRGDFPPLLVDALRRVRDTPPLGREGPASRRRLLAGAFAVAAPERVQGRRLLLLDDVMTSGATLGACSQALLEAGASEVRVAVLARAL